MAFFTAGQTMDPGLMAGLTGVAAGVLAISVGVFAFVPVIIDLSLQKTASADAALQRARRAHFAFDVLLASVLVLGMAVLVGLVSAITTWSHFLEILVGMTSLGVILLVIGTTWLGFLLRQVRTR